mmetsp:Transcript_14274/g.42781  ORF Transcript_14274/g.42781 Transcript_14274/m.42781 type:complete len:83 (+) Transcript_14274:6580-6828(+)
MLAGGALDGGKVLGTYPADLTEDSELNVGRGRIIPTTPWEGLWKAVASWFGVSTADMATVLPNLGSFDDSVIIDVSEMMMFD